MPAGNEEFYGATWATTNIVVGTSSLAVKFAESFADTALKIMAKTSSSWIDSA